MNNETSGAVGWSLPGASPFRVLVPVTDWPLGPFIMLDEVVPGWLAACTRSRPLWRQAIFSAFARGVAERPGPFLERATCEPQGDLPWSELLRRMCHAMLALSPRQIVDAAWGAVPEGFIGALDRVGFSPLSAGSYRNLFRICSDRREKARRRLLGSAGSLDDAKVEAIRTLNPALATPMLLSKVGCPQRADEINSALSFVQEVCSAATSRVLRRSLSNLREWSEFQPWLRNWLGRFDRLPLPPPTAGNDDVRLLDSGSALKSVGLRYRNCLHSKVPRVLAGQCFYYELPEQRWIAAVSPLSNGVCMAKVYGHANMPVPKRAISIVSDKLVNLGVTVATAIEPEERMRSALRMYDRFFDPFGGGLEEELFDLAD